MRDERPGGGTGRGPHRRTVLVAGTLGLGGLSAGAYAVSRGTLELPALAGVGEPYPPEQRRSPVPVGREALERRTTVGPARLVYEVSRRSAPFYVTEAVGARLDRWIALHRRHVGPAPDELRSYGGWVASASAGSWHASGEAFDIAGLRAGGRDLVSLRHDQWRDAPAAELRRRLALYWRTAAGLHHEFADVLTYLFDGAHANHIHVDTGRFGPEQPRLIRRSRAQVQAVQAMCRHVWGRTDVYLTGAFDDVTRAATTRILEQVDGPGELADSREAWQAFLVATMRRG
ncbi:extensin family protein [Terrabacter sp. NPDC080008]|uniref:extensin family protein n=1 Tax=Terrabacter sp. NPDC080008 TaxID=3155176 RepID=UPI00344DC531